MKILEGNERSPWGQHWDMSSVCQCIKI